VRLFFQQARMCRPDFPLSVVEEPLAIKICQLLEGHPLALELAAGWVDTLTCAEILGELTAGLDLLRRAHTPHPERHLSLTHVLQHSWQRLSQEELAVLNRLSFFRGGCTRASAQAIAGATPAVLKGLIQKSLLSMRPGRGSARYYLHELVRSYAEQQLTQAEQLATGLAYTTYFGQFIAHKEPTLYSPQTLTILAEVGEEIDNLAVAWAWAVQQQQLFFFDQTIKVLAQFMQSRARQAEMWGWLQQARPLVEGTTTAIKLYNALTYFVSWAGAEATNYLELAQKGYALAQAAGETDEMGYACFHLGMAYRSLGEMSKAWEVLQEGYNLAQNQWYLMVLANRLCVLATQLSRPEEGLLYGQRARELSYQLGYPLSIYEAEYTLAWVHWYYGRFDLAEQHSSAALVSLPAEQFQIPKMLCMQMQAFIWHGQKRYQEAWPLVQKAAALAQEMGQTATLGSLLLLGGDICCQLALWSEAEKYLLEGLEIQQKLGNKVELAAAKAGLSLVYQQFGQRVLSVQHAQESLLLAWEGQEPTILYHTLLAHVRWLWRGGQAAEAQKTAAGLWHYWAFADHQKEEVAAICAEAGLELVQPTIPATELYQQIVAFTAA
jgi:tetratricopeptide (TPR) repeat protein